MALNNALYEQNSVTIGATEYSLTNNSTVIASQTTDAIVSLWIDVANMAAGDEYQVALYEKVTAAGSQRKTVLANLIGAQPEPFITAAWQVGNGFDFSLQKIAGTDRAFSWSVRGVT